MKIDLVLKEIKKFNKEDLLLVSNMCQELLSKKLSHEDYLKNPSLLEKLTDDELIEICKQDTKNITLIEDIKMRSNEFIRNLLRLFSDGLYHMSADMLYLHFKNLDTELLDKLILTDIDFFQMKLLINVFNMDIASDELKASIINQVSGCGQLTREMYEYGVSDADLKRQIDLGYFVNIPPSLSDRFKSLITSENIHNLFANIVVLDKQGLISEDESIALIMDNMNINMLSKTYIKSYKLYKALIEKDITYALQLNLDNELLNELYADTETKNKVLEIRELAQITSSHNHIYPFVNPFFF